MAFFSGIKPKQWVNLTAIVMMIIFSSYFIVFIVKPTERFREGRDAVRLSAVNTLKTAMETYVATYKSIPSCETVESGTCPISYVLDGTDPVSTVLKESNTLVSIPRQPLGTQNPFCEYRIFIYGQEKNKYYVRWCMESWSEKDTANVELTNGNCSWLGIGNIALCLTGTDLPLVNL